MKGRSGDARSPKPTPKNSPTNTTNYRALLNLHDSPSTNGNNLQRMLNEGPFPPRPKSPSRSNSTLNALRPTLQRKSSNHGAKSSNHVPTLSSNNSANNVATIQNRARSRSFTNAQNPNPSTSAQYFAQERMYLKKMKNNLIDDYYTKGISGDDNLSASDSEDEDDEDSVASTDLTDHDLLADIDDEKYQIDTSIVFPFVSQHTNFSKEDVDDPLVLERLEWQSMLNSVLTGDVVKSERTKLIIPTESFIHETYKDNLWFGIKAKLVGRTEDDQRKIIMYKRTLVDAVLDEILTFKVDQNSIIPAKEQVKEILDKYESVQELWRTFEEMRQDKPVCGSQDFEDRIGGLNAWYSVITAIERETNSLRVWIGNDELDISKSPIAAATNNDDNDDEDGATSSSKVIKKLFDDDNKSLAERLMKEKDVHQIFLKRIFSPLSPWMIKSKQSYLEFSDMFDHLNLPDYLYDLTQLFLIPVRLIKEIIIVRLGYAKKLKNPTLMMIDQMIDDFKSYIAIALEIRLGIIEYCRPSRNWYMGNFWDVDFDHVVLECVRFLIVLLNKKLLDSSRSPKTFRTFKEPEELEANWNFLKNLGLYIESGGAVVAEQFTLLTSKLNARLLSYLSNQLKSPPLYSSEQEINRWFSATTENFGQLRRKLARFTGELSTHFQNSLLFDLRANRIKNLLEVLKHTNHFLIYTGTVEKQGIYFIGSPDLIEKEDDIKTIISGSKIGVRKDKHQFIDLLNLIKEDQVDRGEDDDLGGNESDYDNEAEYGDDIGYVIAICPQKPIVWDGKLIKIHLDKVPITDLKPGKLLLINENSSINLNYLKNVFLETVGDNIGNFVEERCSLPKVHHELMKINKQFYKMSITILDSVIRLREVSSKVSGTQEIINNLFIYAKDYGKNSLRSLDSSRKSTIIMKLISLSIEWVSFICDDCIPTDRKTFRWCVLALEFSMDMTRGFNILAISDDQFYRLKLKVARCMSLLISHFDIMGARSSAAEKKQLLKWSSQRKNLENLKDEDIIAQNREFILKRIEEIEEHRKLLQQEQQSVGRVLDATDLENQFVTLLASSFSSVSIRWQKGRFIGGGTFGSVYAAVNLDTGGVMAVKEIRFHDSQSIKTIVSSIKDEMTVLEMLNHPNIVQYFGIEVHRDKVYIFMEFCEGGSLSGLLEHGRIEDEMVIQVYTLQMLEGLAYLHQSGIVHRDIKPENILLDHNGVIKFVDFGAAKVIANSGRTRMMASRVTPQSNLNSMTGTPMYMSPEVITGGTSARSGIVDIWSLGCCVLEMATGRRPWANLDNEWAIMYHIAAGHLPQFPSPDQLSEAGSKFLAKCLEHDPKKRASAVELLADPWIVSIRQEAFGAIESSASSDLGSEKDSLLDSIL